MTMTKPAVNLSSLNILRDLYTPYATVKIYRFHQREDGTWSKHPPPRPWFEPDSGTDIPPIEGMARRSNFAIAHPDVMI